MDYILLLSIVSSIINLISYFMPDSFRKRKSFIVISFLVIAFISGLLIHSKSRLGRIEDIQKAANELIKERSTEFTNRGFIQAGLSFMETNKDIYPDSYQRAIKIYEKVEGAESSFVETDAAYEMEGLIKGISILNEEK